MIRSIVPVKIRERCREDQTVGILEKRYIQHYKQYVLYLFFCPKRGKHWRNVAKYLDVSERFRRSKSDDRSYISDESCRQYMQTVSDERSNVNEAYQQLFHPVEGSRKGNRKSSQENIYGRKLSAPIPSISDEASMRRLLKQNYR